MEGYNGRVEEGYEIRLFLMKANKYLAVKLVAKNSLLILCTVYI